MAYFWLSAADTSSGIVAMRIMRQRRVFKMRFSFKIAIPLVDACERNSRFNGFFATPKAAEAADATSDATGLKPGANETNPATMILMTFPKLHCLRLASVLNRLGRNLQHPFNRQTCALDYFRRQFHARRQFFHAVAHFFERVHLHVFALAATAVIRRRPHRIDRKSTRLNSSHL